MTVMSVMMSAMSLGRPSRVDEGLPLPLLPPPQVQVGREGFVEEVKLFPYVTAGQRHGEILSRKSVAI